MAEAALLPAALGHLFAEALSSNSFGQYKSDAWLVLADAIEDLGARRLSRSLRQLVASSRRTPPSPYASRRRLRAYASFYDRQHDLRQRVSRALDSLFVRARFYPAPAPGSLEPGAAVEVSKVWASGRTPLYHWSGDYRLVGRTPRRAVVVHDLLDRLVVYDAKDVRPAAAWSRT